MDKGLITAVVILSLTVPIVALFRGLRIPSILAYLAIGAIAGPYQLGMVQPQQQLYMLAEFGVVFLMFSIGLEFNLARFMSIRSLVFVLGAAQVVLTMSVVMLIGLAFGLTWRSGLALGGAVAMSSTAIIGRLISERLETHSPHGRQVMGVLLFQDIAVVPLLILVPSLAAPQGDLWLDLGTALSKAAVVLLAIFFIGQKLVQPLFNLIARRHSAELFMLNVLWVVLGMAALTRLAGLSLALGAFLGGMLISETMYRHQVESDIRPFRDILLGLFFITIGMELDLLKIWRDLTEVMAILVALVIGKAAIVTMLSLAMRSNPVTAFRAGVQLSFAGEFGFVLLSQAGDLQLLAPHILQSTLAAMLISMMLGPLLIHKSRRLVKLILGHSVWASKTDLDTVAAMAGNLADHVIICGYGRTGRSLVSLLARENIPYLVLELDGMLVTRAEDSGKRVIFGDAGKKEILAAAGVQRARALVITHNDFGSGMRTLHQVRELRSELPVIVRTDDDSRLDQLKKAGATEVVPEILESSLMLATQTMLLIGVTPGKVEEAIRRARAERYSLPKS
ncbi:MAG TPA: cation:proton antiporter [Novimethylophilus sp.]|jgi:CPA2 family monovalent cation:H+ antiporter-2|uniref:cation:proton antiporter n=1 Tax=Novimethylophilus sp. TaxID=2137426 RepID=UPI002F429B85